MTDRYFPELGSDAEWSVQIILQNALEDPGYLEDENCPYSHELREIFRRSVEIVDEVVDESIDLVVESRNLYVKLKESAQKLDDRDNAEKMAFFRTATALLEKLISMQERAHNIRQVSLFYKTVLDVFESELDPGQITRIREKFKEFT